MCLCVSACPNGTTGCSNNPFMTFFQASMTGSALSLYLEETKANEDSMFQSEISPIKREGIHGESKNKSNPNMSTGARDVPSRGKGDPSDMLSPTTLALHKVVLFGSDFTLQSFVSKQRNSHAGNIGNASDYSPQITVQIFTTRKWYQDLTWQPQVGTRYSGRGSKSTDTTL